MNLVALFWSDFNSPELRRIVARLKEGYQVLALDVKVVLFCVQNNIPCTCIEDWVDRETIYQCTVLAHHFEKTWFRDYRRLFSRDGLCFPDLDSEAMYHFWRETVVASVFMELFFKKGGREIFIPRNEKAPSVYYYRADTWKSIVENYLNKAQGPYSMLDRVKAFAGDLRMIDSAIGDARFSPGFKSHSSLEKGDMPSVKEYRPAPLKIAFAINPGEIGRFEPAIQKIKHLEWAHTTVYLNTHDPKQCDTLAREWGIPFLPIPATDRAAGRLSEALYSACQKVRSNCVGRLGYSIAVDYHFKYYCFHRWPALYAMYEGWKILWEREQPSAVVVSSLLDAESQLPAVAANRYGIETFSLPHARFLSIENSQSGRQILYDFVPYRNDLEKVGVDPGRLVGCRDLLGSYPYPTYRRVAIEKKAINILALVGNTNGVVEDGDLLVPRVLASAQIEAIRCLANPPDELKESVQIKFKVHPVGAEMEMFELAGVNIDESLLPTDTDFTAALDSFDLVADINNTGTAVLSAINREMPLLMWWNGLVKRVNYNVEVLLEAGESISDGREFWRCVSRIVDDGDYRKKLTGKSKAFKKKYMNTDRYPTLAQIIRRSLIEGKTLRPADQFVSRASARAALLERISQSPGDVDALVDLALMAAKSDTKEALAFLQEALILDPAHPGALELKDRIEKGGKPAG